uniref:ZP domain-containing protein n=1 Tax=Fundulus heteroclitus TaxID=8078 RepID=A0A3Q2TU96_FUNHE
MAPFSVIHLLVTGLELCFSRQFHGKVICLQFSPRLLLFRPLRASVAEQQQSAGLCGAEGDESFRSFKRYGIKSRYILTAEHQITMQCDFRVAVKSQPGELQLKVVVLVHHL